jgi:hypothetical protein
MTLYPSSISIRADDGKTGLYASSWISNGVNMVDYSLRLASGVNMPGYKNEVRLYYTGLTTKLANGGKKVAFKAIFEDTGYNSTDDAPHLFSTDCAAWLQFTGSTYGHLPLDEFVFELDADGNAVAIENLALRVTMKKTSGPAGGSVSPEMGGPVPMPGQGEQTPGDVVPGPGQEPAEPPGQKPDEVEDKGGEDDDDDKERDEGGEMKGPDDDVLPDEKSP